MPEGSILKHAFTELMYLHNLGYKCWITRVTELAKSYSLDLKSFTYNNETKRHIKDIVKNKYIQNWKTSLLRTDINPILRTYSLFKFEFELEPYLYHIKNPKYRHSFARFRSSSHPLEIEKGRHTNPIIPLENRICTICNVIEDELHFLINCSLYNEKKKEITHDFSNCQQKQG